MRDYYDILGVDRKASKDEIKKAFHKLAHKYHPDKQGGNADKFKEVNEAYGVLSNEKKRAEYDAYGRVFSGGGAGQQGQGAAGFDFSGFDFSDFASQFAGAQGGGQQFDFGDIFGDIFGGRGQRVKRGRDISIDLEISFKDSVFGTTRKVLLTKASQCDTCDGRGAAPGTEMQTCKTCEGKGKIHDTKSSVFGTFTTVRACEACHGQGKVPKEKCKTCKGLGILRKEEEVSIAIPAGINNGEMIRLQGAGEAVQGGVPGDLYIKIHVPKDNTFRKEGQNLVMDLKVKLTDAILGSTYTVDTLDGSIKVKIPAGVSFGETLRVKGKGVPLGDGRRGDLLIKIHITLPEKLSRKAKQAIEDLREEGI